METRKVAIDFSKVPWATQDAEAKMLIPKEGIFHEVLDDLVASTDAPAVYHLGGVFTVAAAALGQCDIHVGDASNPTIQPMAIWSAVIGDSGDRKSSALERSVDSLRQVAPGRLFPTDGSQEAWHLSLSEQPTSLLYRDELSGLFDNAARSYSMGLRTWLLETWAGHDMTRKTLTHKECTIIRPRFSILGGIPPQVFTEKTNRSDWSSGFLARFVYWGGRRESWNALQRGGSSGKFTKWLSTVAIPSQGSIWLSRETVDPLLDWVYNEVELRRAEYKPEVSSALQRLQSTGYKLAAIYEMQKRTKPFGYGTAEQQVRVSQESVIAIIPVLNMLKRTIMELFTTSMVSLESSDEERVIELFRKCDGLSRKSVAENTSLSAKKVNEILNNLVKVGRLSEQIHKIDNGKAGRPGYIYRLI
jgi:hypothetical protein